MPTRRGKTPDDYLTLTPGELKRVQEAIAILGTITATANPQAALARLQSVEDLCRRLVRDAFWRAF